MKLEKTAAAEQGMPIRTAALISGIGLLLMAVIAPLANFVAIQGAVDPGSAEATAANIAASAQKFRLGALGLILVAILDVIVAWGLYELFRKESPSLALLGAWLRLIYAAVFLMAIFPLFEAVRIASSDASAAMQSIEMFQDGWMVGLIVFGFHLGVVGATACRSTFIHWLFGVLLIIAGAGYIIDGVATLALPSYGLELSLYTFVGEVLLIFWLLIRGPRITTVPRS